MLEICIMLFFLLGGRAREDALAHTSHACKPNSAAFLDISKAQKPIYCVCVTNCSVFSSTIFFHFVSDLERLVLHRHFFPKPAAYGFQINFTYLPGRIFDGSGEWQLLLQDP
jgi:hypothetical protein